MMVEAGAKLLPEDVMAEAILFGHRALQPIIDLQEQLQKAVGKPKRIPYLEPGTGSVLDFVAGVDAKREFVVVDVETTGTDPKMADLVEIARRQGQGRQDHRPLVDARQAGPPDRRPPDARHHRQGRREGARRRPTRRRKLLEFIGDALVVGHNVGFDLGFIEEALGDGTRFEQGRYLDTLVIAREGYPDLQNYKLADAGGVLRHRALPEPPGAAGRRGDRQPPALVRERPAGSHLDAARRRSPTRSGPSATVATRTSSSTRRKREARVSKSLFSLVHKKTVRGSSSTRASGWTAAA